MSIQMRNHGGTCCGATHLYLGSLSSPDTVVPPMRKFNWRKLSETGLNVNNYSQNPSTAKNTLSYLTHVGYVPPAYSIDRPSETASERAKALLDGYKKSGRPHGIIEVILTDKQKAWHDLLIEEGFVQTVTATNSNSSRDITVYLLAY